MLEALIKVSRYFIRSRGHGCTGIGQIAAATYGWRALPFIMQLSGDCWHEHPSR